MSVIDHYENHLAGYYTWIYGGLENKIKDNAAFFSENNIRPHLTGTAIDLGAGSGFQSIPLADAGFKVFSVDFSGKLLDELKNRKNSSDISIIRSDIMNFSSYENLNPELIVCMGDTLTHIGSLTDVESMLNNCCKLLVKGGSLILTFRDLTHELSGINRFIPVMNDEKRIFTCFLEYFKDHVIVHDIVNERAGGRWQQKISSYRKIKIPPETIKKYLNELNFNLIVFKVDKGIVTVIAVKQ